MKLIAGLGNPGKEYEFTRHNTGFLMVDFYALNNNFKISRLKQRALVGEHMINGEKIIFAKPQTYMNLSGESVRALASYYNIPTKDIIIIYDDLSLPLGKIRIREKGTDGGHNGIKNIIYQLQSDEFLRIKIGISECFGEDMIGHVLGGFSKAELELLRKVAVNVSNALEEIIINGAESAMNKFNGLVAE